MSIHDVLKTALGAVPGGTTLAYVDMKANLVLATQSTTRSPQEVFNSLSSIGRQVLNTSALAQTVRDMSTRADFAALKGSEAMFVAARSPKHEDHALVVVCARDADVDSVKLIMRDTREAIANVL